MNTYLVLAALLLVPLLPIVILFKGLRSSATVGGKLKELGMLKDIQIKLGGAFAGYVVIVGGVLFYLEYQRSHPLEQVWQVSGSLKFEDFEDFQNTISYKNVQVLVDPPSYSPLEDGTFKMSITVRPRNGKPEFPDITFLHPMYRPAVVHLGKVAKPNDEEKSIRLDTEILLHKENE